MKLKLNIYKIFSLSTLSFIIPSIAFATVPTLPGASSFSDFKSFVNFLVYSFFNPFMYIISTLIFIYFFLGVAKYIWNAGDMEKRKEGYWMLVHGVIAITITMSIWGIIYFLMNSFGFIVPQGSLGGYSSYTPQSLPPGASGGWFYNNN